MLTEGDSKYHEHAQYSVGHPGEKEGSGGNHTHDHNSPSPETEKIESKTASYKLDKIYYLQSLLVALRGFEHWQYGQLSI